MPKINIGGNQITKFSHLEYHSTKSGFDLQTFKHDVLDNIGLQISGISRQQTASMLISIGAQYSHFHKVLFPILPFTPFVATSLVPARSLTELLPRATGTLLLSFQECMVKLNFSKSFNLSTSASMPDKGRDLLEDVLPNTMIRKLNLILLLIVVIKLIPT